jgi:hypothetical protein
MNNKTYQNIMKLQDLPQEIQGRLNAERVLLSKCWYKNDSYHITLVSEDGRRFFTAVRKQSPYCNSKGAYMPFGGGSEWHLAYGVVQFDYETEPMGNGKKYFWTKGKTYGKSANGTVIPKKVNTKEEVLEIAKQIGLFEI